MIAARKKGLFVGSVVMAFALGGLVASLAAQNAKQPGPVEFPPRSGTVLVLPVRIIDGDTVEFWWLVGPEHGRFAKINAPESKTPEGMASKAFLQGKLTLNVPAKADLHGREKYGRALIELYDAAGNPYSKIMVDAGMAKWWNGVGPRP